MKIFSQIEITPDEMGKIAKAVSDRIDGDKDAICLLLYFCNVLLFFSYRILIMKMLIEREVDFQSLRRELNTSDGGLFSRLRALEQEGLLAYRKNSAEEGQQRYILLQKNENKNLVTSENTC